MVSKHNLQNRRNQPTGEYYIQLVSPVIENRQATDYYALTANNGKISHSCNYTESNLIFQLIHSSQAAIGFAKARLTHVMLFVQLPSAANPKVRAML